MNAKVQDQNFIIFGATSKNVIPARAGIQNFQTILDSRRLPHTGYGAGVTNW
jgi:hypothetical protein